MCFHGGSRGEIDAYGISQHPPDGAIQMRDLRNRIVHDYLPERLHEIYSLILNEYGPELSRVKEGISTIKTKE